MYFSDDFQCYSKDFKYIIINFMMGSICYEVIFEDRVYNGISGCVAAKELHDRIRKTI